MQDKVIIQSNNSGKVKLELDVQTVAPFSGLEKPMKCQNDSSLVKFESSTEEDKDVATEEDTIMMYPVKLKANKDG